MYLCILFGSHDKKALTDCSLRRRCDVFLKDKRTIRKFKHDVMKMNAEVEIRLQLFLTSVFDEGDGLVFSSHRFILRLKRARNTLCLKF